MMRFKRLLQFTKESQNETIKFSGKLDIIKSLVLKVVPQEQKI